MKLGTPDYPAKGAQVSGCTSAHVTCVPCTGRYLDLRRLRFCSWLVLCTRGSQVQITGADSQITSCRLQVADYRITDYRITDYRTPDLQNYKLQIRFQRTVNFAGVSEIVGRRGVLVAHLHKVPTVQSTYLIKTSDPR